jgi:hypothetical protein
LEQGNPVCLASSNDSFEEWQGTVPLYAEADWGETIEATNYTIENAFIGLTSFLNVRNHRRILSARSVFEGSLSHLVGLEPWQFNGRVPTATVLKYWSKLRLIAELFQMNAVRSGATDRKEGEKIDRE